MDVYKSLIKEQTLMTKFHNISWEAVDEMTSFERQYFNEVIAETLKKLKEEGQQ